METPNDYAGILTEAIMVKVSKKLPGLSAHEYNRIYSSVYDVLHECLEQKVAIQLSPIKSS